MTALIMFGMLALIVAIVVSVIVGLVLTLSAQRTPPIPAPSAPRSLPAPTQYPATTQALSDAEALFSSGRISQAEHQAMRNRILNISNTEFR